MGNETPVMGIPIPYPSTTGIDELFDYDRFLVEAFTKVDEMKVIGSTQIRNASKYSNLQTALDELGSLGGGILVFPKGTYVIGNTTTLNVPANVWMIGADAVVKSASDATTSTAPYLSIQGEGVRIVGLQFLGSETQQGFVRPAVITNGNAASFEQCKFIGVRSVIHRHSTDNGVAVFKNCLFRNLWGDWIEADSSLQIDGCIFLKTNDLVSTNSVYRNRGTAIRLLLNKPIKVDIDKCQFDGILRNIILFEGSSNANFLTLNLNNSVAKNYGVGHFGTQSEVDAEWAVVVSEPDGLGRLLSTPDTTLYADISINNTVAEGTAGIDLPVNYAGSNSSIKQGVLRMWSCRLKRTGLKPTALTTLVFFRVFNGAYTGVEIDDAGVSATSHTALVLSAAPTTDIYDRTPHIFTGCSFRRSAIQIQPNGDNRWSMVGCSFEIGSPLPKTFLSVVAPQFLGASIYTDIGGRFNYGGSGYPPSSDSFGFTFQGYSGTQDASTEVVRIKTHHTSEPFSIRGGGFVSSLRGQYFSIPAEDFRLGGAVSPSSVTWNSVLIPTLSIPYNSSNYTGHFVAATLPLDPVHIDFVQSSRVRITVDVSAATGADLGANQFVYFTMGLYFVAWNSNTPSLVKQQTVTIGSSSSTTPSRVRLYSMTINPSEQGSLGSGIYILRIDRSTGTGDTNTPLHIFGAQIFIPVKDKQLT